MGSYNVYCVGRDGKNIYLGDHVLYYASPRSKQPKLAVVVGIQASVNSKGAMVKLAGQKSWHASATMKAVRVGVLENALVKVFSERGIMMPLEELVPIADTVRNAVQLESLEAEINEAAGGPGQDGEVSA